MIFKKLKRNKNKIKPRRLKLKMFAAVVLSCILVFIRPRCSLSQSSSPHFDNQTMDERVISDRDFNSFENND